MKLVIARDRWLRGTGIGCLLDNQGKMCCLGFLLKAQGVPDEALLNHPFYPVSPHCWPSSTNLRVLDDLTRTNDAAYVTGEDREAWIIEGMKHLDVECEFAGDSDAY